jgi:hypothetical protein
MSMLSLEQRQAIDLEESRKYLSGESQPVTRAEVKKMLREFARIVDKKHGQRIARLERQAKELQGWKYRGVWAGRAETYQKGNFATHDGALWIALKDDPGKPGEGDGWQLVAKGGAR